MAALIPPAGSLALGSGRSSGRRDVSDDAGFGDVLVSGFVQPWVCLQVVPAPVDQTQTRAHHNQDFVVPPEVPQAHDRPAPSELRRTDKSQLLNGLVGNFCQ